MKRSERNRINIRCTPALIDGVENKACSECVTKSDWVRRVLAEAIGQPRLADMPHVRPNGQDYWPPKIG
jgi:hypothetical protein